MEAPIELKKFEGERNRRMHHYLWHTVRNGWEWFTADEKNKLTSLGWEPPRAGRKKLPDGSRGVHFHNNSGEDFLYMHREMIRHANMKLMEIGNTTYKIIGWESLPEINDSYFPVPPAWDSGDTDFNPYLKESKDDTFFENTMKNWDAQFKDKTYLKSISLGELGARIEYSIHNRMHVRWCKKLLETRPPVDDDKPESIHIKWDCYTYEWLADEYSAHVGSIFWKIHGWVDNRVKDWAEANNITDIKWKGKWLGNIPHNGGHELAKSETDFFMNMNSVENSFVNNMEEALKVVQLSDVRCHFYDTFSE